MIAVHILWCVTLNFFNAQKMYRYILSSFDVEKYITKKNRNRQFNSVKFDRITSSRLFFTAV
jgi:hypothetical protein